MKTQFLSRAIRQVLTAGFMSGLMFGVANTAIAASCPTYGLQDNKLNDTQFFTMLIGGNGSIQTANLGAEYKGYDIEGLTIHPLTGELYASSGDDAVDGNPIGGLYKVNKATGGLTYIGQAYEGEISALEFSKDGQKLYGWVDRQGLIEINPLTAASKMLYANAHAMIEDITTGTNAKGESIIYGVAGNKLYAYNLTANAPELLACDTLPSEAESIEMLADGTLLYGLHDGEESKLYQVALHDGCKVLNQGSLDTQVYYDIEGLATPSSCGTCPPDETPWQYVYDSFTDGSDSWGFGGSSYEIYAMGVKQEGDLITVAVATNTAMEGVASGDVNIALGDVFFDFSGAAANGGKVFNNQPNIDANAATAIKNAQIEAENQVTIEKNKTLPANKQIKLKSLLAYKPLVEGVYGVRFTSANDAGVSGLGLYSVIGSKAVGSTNHGYSSLKAYTDTANNYKANPSLGHVPLDATYFKGYASGGQTPNVISSGNLASTLLPASSSAMQSLNFDLTGAKVDARNVSKASKPGTPPQIQVVAFSFKRPANFKGDFTAYLFTECINDGVALKGSIKVCE